MKKKMNATAPKTENIVYAMSFQGEYVIDRINKLTIGRRFIDADVGTVTCIKPANGSYGSRRFSVKGSTFLKSGKYSLGGIRSRVATYM